MTAGFSRPAQLVVAFYTRFGFSPVGDSGRMAIRL